MERDASQQRGDKEIVRQLEAALSFFLAQYEIKSHQRAELQIISEVPKTVDSQNSTINDLAIKNSRANSPK